jgi:hypothetical protein
MTKFVVTVWRLRLVTETGAARPLQARSRFIPKQWQSMRISVVYSHNALGKFLDDFGVGGAITEQEIDELAVLTREAREFTGSPPSVGAEDYWWQPLGVLG